MASARAYIKQRKKIGRLSGRGEHRRRSPLQFGNLCGYIVIRRILKPRIKISLRLQIKQFSHILVLYLNVVD